LGIRVGGRRSTDHIESSIVSCTKSSVETGSCQLSANITSRAAQAEGIFHLVISRSDWTSHVDVADINLYQSCQNGSDLIRIECVGSSIARDFDGDRASVSVGDVASIASETWGTDTITIVGTRGVFSSSTLSLRARVDMVSTLKSSVSWFAKAIRSNSSSYICHTISVIRASMVRRATQCGTSGTSTSRFAFTDSLRIAL